MDKIAVLIPCYNESQTIQKVVADFRQALPEAVIYVYDNNSSDQTDELARRAGAVVRYERQQGSGVPPHGAGAPVPHADCLRLCVPGGDPVLFRRDAAADHDTEKSAGF